jgi:hypothetical protein
MDLRKCAPGPCGETYPTATNDATVAMNIKVEEVSDIDVEEERPVPMTFVGIKAEHEVRCMSACTLLACFTQYKNCPLSVSSPSICRFCFEESFMTCLNCIVFPCTLLVVYLAQFALRR